MDINARIRKTIDGWQDYKKEHYNDYFAVSKYSTKLPINKEEAMKLKQSGCYMIAYLEDNELVECVGCVSYDINDAKEGLKELMLSGKGTFRYGEYKIIKINDYMIL